MSMDALEFLIIEQELDEARKEIESLRAELKLSRENAANIEHNRKLNADEKQRAIRERDEARQTVEQLREDLPGWKMENAELRQANAALLDTARSALRLFDSGDLSAEDALEMLRAQYDTAQPKVVCPECGYTRLAESPGKANRYLCAKCDHIFDLDTAQPTAPSAMPKFSGEGCYMFGLSPNEEGEIECVARIADNMIRFKITEIDLKRMLRSIHLWKARQLDTAQGEDERK